MVTTPDFCQLREGHARELRNGLNFSSECSDLARAGFRRYAAVRMKTLVIEDDPKTARALKTGLRDEGFDAVIARTGEEGLTLLGGEKFDLVVLDWMLPGRDGLDILKTVRAGGSRVPVLLLTARDAVDDRVLGLDAGADDYLVKPFAFAELLARARALTRRTSSEPVPEYHVADLMLDLENRRVRRGALEIEITPREFDVLAYLLRHCGQVVTREMLAQEVWRETRRITSLDNVIDVHIAHLRRKLDADAAVKLIHTVRGVGFVLREDAS
jgi:two-component system copper resistance phosphate regulon response regulator CusR